MKWGMQAFDTFGVVPPGLRHRAPGQPGIPGARRAQEQGRRRTTPTRLVGTDSHTTMINGIGVVGWGVGGIEAEAGMLGQPVYFLTPDVVGFELTGQLREGVTATDLVLTVTEILRKAQGGRQVRRVLRRRHAHAGPARPRDHRQHGARVRRDDGLLPGRREDDRVLQGHRPHQGRDRGLRGLLQGAEACSACRWPARSTTRSVVKLDLSTVVPSLAGPKRPQDRIEIRQLSSPSSPSCSAQPTADNGFNQPADKLAKTFTTDSGLDDQERRRADRRHHQLHQHQQPRRAAGRRPAGEEGGRGGLKVKPHIKTSLAPGSRIVTEYLDQGRPAALPGKARLQRRGLRLHHLHRQRRRPDARDQRADHRRTTWSAPPCCRATATSRPASTRT